MSAKLLKGLAEKKCVVTNIITGEVIVYWPDSGILKSILIPSGKTIDLLKYATVAQLRKSPNLKRLAGKSLKIN